MSGPWVSCKGYQGKEIKWQEGTMLARNNQHLSCMLSMQGAVCARGFLTSGPLCLGAQLSSLLFLGAGTDPMK